MDCLIPILILLAIYLLIALLTVIHGWVMGKATKIRENEYNRRLREELSTAKIEQETLASKVRHELQGEKTKVELLRDKTRKMWQELQEERSRVELFRDETHERLRLERELILQQIQEEKETLQRNQQERERFVQICKEFEKSFIHGRLWLAQMIAEAISNDDEKLERYLRRKKYRAGKAADQVKLLSVERRELAERVKFLEYHIKSLYEYFPTLEDFEDSILNEAFDFASSKMQPEDLEDEDPVRIFVSNAEYEKMGSAERNQLALDRYRNRRLSPWQIGRFYERYVGYLYEQMGYEVEYFGALRGFEDMGRDLICRGTEDILIVQAKYWSKEKLIHEKHVFQTFGTAILFQINTPSQEIFEQRVKPVLITSTCLGTVAKRAADFLEVQVVEMQELDKSYPMIKCNINHSTNERIYHLPFDQQYDTARIIPSKGERYVASAAEAEALGFRRAFRHRHVQE